MIKRLNFIIEVKSMKAAFYLPIVGFMIVLGRTLTIEHFDMYYFWLIEFGLIPLAGWWTVFLFYEYFEENNAELLFSYPVPYLFHGITRVVAFLTFYILMLIITILIINVKISGTTFLALSTQYIPEAILFSGLAFMITALMKNIMIPLIFIGFYVASEFFFSGQFMPWYHAMYFNETPLNFSDIYLKSTVTLFMSIVFFTLGQIFLRLRSIE